MCFALHKDLFDLLQTGDWCHTCQIIKLVGLIVVGDKKGTPLDAHVHEEQPPHVGGHYFGKHSQHLSLFLRM